MNQKSFSQTDFRLNPVIVTGSLVLLLILVILPFWIWFFCRIEPGPDQLAVLIRKTGQDLPTGQVIALTPDQKGVQPDVLPTGRYFYNPYTWGWQYTGITDVPAGKLGVLTRLYGNDPPPGGIIAAEGQKGIVSEVLRPGKYHLNPLAYEVQMFDAITIRPGHVGVKTSLVGSDPLTDPGAEPAAHPLIAGSGSKGVQAEVLDPGTYYLNPFEVSVIPMNLQSQRFEMSGDDAISFLTVDGFTVIVEGTIEFAIRHEMAAELTHRVGDMDDILKKIILPRARGFSRIEGSKNPATSYIVGETRQKFQDSLTTHLVEKSREWGVDIKEVLIRNISPPQQISSIIRSREVAVQEAKKFEQQIEEARSQAELTRQEMLALQNKEKVAADTARIRAVIQAKQDMAVHLLAADKELEVARLENDAALAQAEAQLLKATAEQDVIRLQNDAEAGVLRNHAEAFGNGMGYARYLLYQKVGPRIGTILTSDDPDGLGGLFRSYLPAGSGSNAPAPAKGGAR